MVYDWVNNAALVKIRDARDPGWVPAISAGTGFLRWMGRALHCWGIVLLYYTHVYVRLCFKMV